MKEDADGGVPGGAYSDISQSLVSPVDTALPSATATAMIRVTAPATLPEDYTFDAQLGDRVFSVKVPLGGVEEGQQFSVPLPSSAVLNDDAPSAPRTSVPVGNFRDGLCDCCHYGCCHPMLWNSYCCPAVALGQVMTRLRLTWTGEPGSAGDASKTFKVTLGLTVGYFGLYMILGWLMRSFVTSTLAPTDDDFNYGTYTYDASPGYYVFYYARNALHLCFLVYIIIAATRTRSYLRSKYSIPVQNCGTLEDFCCSFWCLCCSVSQMGRHTADYGTYAGKCCSETGLPPNVPGLDDSGGGASQPVMAEIV